MGKFGIATRPDVAPTGYALAHNEVWVNGIKHEVVLDEVELDKRIIAAGTAGACALNETVDNSAAKQEDEAA